MADSTRLAALRALACSPGAARAIVAADDWIAHGLGRGQLHELFAGADEGASLTGFAVALTLAAAATPILWLRTDRAQRDGGRLYATGLHELGLDPAALVLAVVEDEAALLRAAGDATRCPGFGTVVLEAWGRAPGIDLTATRRLQLAAEGSGVTALILRLDAQPVPSAAATRWRVAPCPSTPLDADAPGGPTFLIDLERRRGGHAGQRWRVEWDRDTQRFSAAPLSGAGLSLAADRPAARDPAAPLRRHG